jgi:hypothetical protein
MVMKLKNHCDTQQGVGAISNTRCYQTRVYVLTTHVLLNIFNNYVILDFNKNENENFNGNRVHS